MPLHLLVIWLVMAYLITGKEHPFKGGKPYMGELFFCIKKPRCLLSGLSLY